MPLTQTRRGRSVSVTKRLVLTAIFAALAYAAMSVFRFNVTFLTFDLKDAVITLAGLLLGPVTALTVSLLVAVLEFITVGDTGWYGLVMNFTSSATFSVVCALVYAYNKKLSGAIISLCSGVVVMVAVMMGMNLLVTPFYQGVSRSVIVDMIPTLFLPFNIVKGLVNAALVMILYKPVHRAMQAARLMPRSVSGDAAVDPALRKKRLWQSILVSVAGLALLVAAIAVFIFVMNGQFELFK